ncbi:MAG: ABC transporter permease [Bacteroidales bacterium]|nr:ABC transporter permease [Bacteroidales bacterium]
MNFAFYIARRYLFAKKSQHVINLISGISLVGIMIGTMSMIIVLSAMNGLDLLMTSLYSSFDPDIRITPAEGKTFSPSGEQKKALEKSSFVLSFSEVLEDDVMLMYNENQHFVILKGVDDNFLKVCRIDSMLSEGVYFTSNTNPDRGILGVGAQQYLGLSNPLFTEINIYAPVKSGTLLSPENAFRRRNLTITGVFDIEEESNTKYLLTSLDYAREIFQQETGISAIEIRVNPEYTREKAAENLKQIFGDSCKIKTLEEQRESFYKVSRTEKWAIFLILSFILLISSFNIIGSLSMLIIEKQQDIVNLQSIGAGKRLISNIFLTEGWLISWLGTLGGLLLGGIICWLQIEFGWIKIAAEGNFIFEAYPVSLKISDFFLTGATVLGIGWITAWIPARIIVKKYIQNG